MVDENNAEETKKAQQRVLIAKDALKWEAAGALLPSKAFGYVSPVNRHYDLMYSNKQARDVVLGPCRVCALGGLMVAKAVRYNAVTASQLILNHGSGALVCLEDHFDKEQLDIIESCYEIWTWWHGSARDWMFFVDRPARFRAIMKNIIRHKGTFVPEDVRP